MKSIVSNLKPYSNFKNNYIKLSNSDEYHADSIEPLIERSPDSPYDNNSLIIVESKIDYNNHIGICLTQSGDIFEGKFNNFDQPSVGSLKFKNGSTYFGKVSVNEYKEIHLKKGIYREPSGFQVTGEFLDSVPHGKATLLIPVHNRKKNFFSYDYQKLIKVEGYFTFGNLNSGVFYYRDGSKYKTKLVKEGFHGQGTYFNNGKSHERRYKNGLEENILFRYAPMFFDSKEAYEEKLYNKENKGINIEKHVHPVDAYFNRLKIAQEISQRKRY
jgi:hypothetical protein